MTGWQLKGNRFSDNRSSDSSTVASIVAGTDETSFRDQMLPPAPTRPRWDTPIYDGLLAEAVTTGGVDG